MISTEGRTYVGFPVTGLGFVSQPSRENGRERLDLLAELVRRLAGEAHDLPVQLGHRREQSRSGSRRGASA